MDYSLFEKLKTNPKLIDNILDGGGKQLGDVDLDNLQIEVMSSGFPSLDSNYMLLKKGEGELIIVGGRPSSGKSALMFQLALNVSRELPVHVFSLEMSQESIVRRLISQIIEKPLSEIQLGWVDRTLLEKAKNQLQEYHYIIDDTSGISVSELCDRARNRAKKFGTRLVVIDYLQLLRTEKGHSKDAEIGEITKELKSLARDLQSPVIVGSQLNRQCEVRGAGSGDYRPILSDLRESGNIEQDSDIILAIHREYRYTKLRPGKADVLVLKNRNGSIGETEMNFHADQTKFEDLGGV